MGVRAPPGPWGEGACTHLLRTLRRAARRESPGWLPRRRTGPGRIQGQSAGREAGRPLAARRTNGGGGESPPSRWRAQRTARRALVHRCREAAVCKGQSGVNAGRGGSAAAELARTWKPAAMPAISGGAWREANGDVLALSSQACRCRGSHQSGTATSPLHVPEHGGLEPRKRKITVLQASGGVSIERAAVSPATVHLAVPKRHGERHLAAVRATGQRLHPRAGVHAGGGVYRPVPGRRVGATGHRQRHCAHEAGWRRHRHRPRADCARFHTLRGHGVQVRQQHAGHLRGRESTWLRPVHSVQSGPCHMPRRRSRRACCRG